MIVKLITMLIKTISQGYFVKLILFSSFVTLLIYIIFISSVIMLFSATSFTSIPYLETIFDWLASASIVFVATILFPALLPLVANIFQEDIANLIESREYNITAQHKLPIVGEILNSISFMLWFIFLNILILPLLIFPPIYAVVYFVMSSHLLGREFFEIVAARHSLRKGARRLRKRNRGAVLLAGMIITAMSLLPVVAFYAPFLAVALMVHLYHMLDGKRGKIQAIEKSARSASEEK